ncbi:hypothetical protein H4R35_005610 [Dimargaris xerosporica]|nr:hypothetical protein H4R35_005610 [Dimargaris xerosporica]
MLTTVQHSRPCSSPPLDSTYPWLPRLTSHDEHRHDLANETQRQRQEAFAELRQQTTYYNTWFVEHMKMIDAQRSPADSCDTSIARTTVEIEPNCRRSASFTNKDSSLPSYDDSETEVIIHATSTPLPSTIPSTASSFSSSALALEPTGIDEALDAMITTMASDWTVKDYSLAQGPAASDQSANGDDLGWVGDMW